MVRWVIEWQDEGDEQAWAESLAWTRAQIDAHARGEVAVLVRGDAVWAPALRAALAAVLPPQRVRMWWSVPGAGGNAVAALRAAALACVLPEAVAYPVAQLPAGIRAVWRAADLPPLRPQGRPPLAYVSPWPPERTGVADYGAELLPALEEHYEVIPVATQQRVQLPAPWAERVRDVAWLRRGEVERVIYHVGNSWFHRHMPSLLQEVPGVVVLHDFFLSGLFAWLEEQEGVPGAWARALLDAHGYEALCVRRRDPEAAKWRFPANWPVIAAAQGVIVHSHHARDLARRWYGEEVGDDWAVIPHLRVPPSAPRDQVQAKRALGLASEDFLVCSFGFLTPAKLCERIVTAWGRSALARDERAHLVFVGEVGGEYASRVSEAIRQAGLKGQVRITGYASPELFRRYLAAADVAVQLRAHSRGESSGTVLDCLAHGVATIVNAHGSMAELEASALWRLPDEFSDEALVEALETLWREPEHRQALAQRAREAIVSGHAPEHCAQRYAEAIERFQRRAQQGWPAAVRTIAHGQALTPEQRRAWAQALAVSVPEPVPSRRLWLDVTATARHDLRTGIERVVRALCWALLQDPPRGLRPQPVVLDQAQGRWVYREAHDFAATVLGQEPWSELVCEPVLPQAGDVVLTLDLSAGMLPQACQDGFFARLRTAGVKVFSVVYDLLPLRRPEVFPPGADVPFAAWLEAVNTLDGALCISQAVATDLLRWRSEHGLSAAEFRIGWFHLGADLEHSAPSKGMPPQAARVLEALRARPSVLMVGTVEPRKGYAQVLSAFERLWADGVDVNLVIVGREGWLGVPAPGRRDIPQTVRRLREHPQKGVRLFWLEGISDEYLELVYAASSGLLAASLDEGFGLPLIEAARRGVPLLVRDIPVFREVAGPHAAYFTGEDPESLAQALRQWLHDIAHGVHPRSEAMPWQSWVESARQVSEFLLRSDGGDAGHEQKTVGQSCEDKDGF